MKNNTSVVLCLLSLLLCSCSTQSSFRTTMPSSKPLVIAQPSTNYAARIPQKISTREKVIVVDPNVHAWGAYGSDGNLIRGGLATAGGNWCPDIGRSCRTGAGSFRINSLGNPGCKSTLYPRPRGGAPMPYCMFFNRNQALHGSYNVVDGNVSHGCVRLQVGDAAWLRYNFANVGTKVIVRSY